MPSIPIPENAIESDEAWYMILKHAHETAQKRRQKRLNRENSDGDES